MYLPAILKNSQYVQRTKNKFGFNPAVGPTIEDIWYPGGRKLYFTTNRTVQIFSSSAQDNAAGTGAYQISIDYLDSLYAEKTAIVNLNGTAIVNLTGVMVINSCYVLKANNDGTGRFSNQGNITLRDSVTSEIMDFIPATFNSAVSALYTVPAGFYAVCDYSFCEAQLGPEYFAIFTIQRPGEAFRIEWPFFVNSILAHRDFIAIAPEKSNLAMKVFRNAGSGNPEVNAGFRFNLVKKEILEALYAKEGVPYPT